MERGKYNTISGSVNYAVVCPKGCKPGGFVTRMWADQRRAADAAEAAEVARNYPSLAPEGILPTTEQVERARKALWGEEETSPLKPCDAIYPADPRVTCVGHGKCQIECHRGIIGEGDRRHFVWWGEDCKEQGKST